MPGWLIAGILALGAVPPFPHEFSWNKAGVSEAEFAEDLAACRAAFLDGLPNRMHRALDRRVDWPLVDRRSERAISAHWIHALDDYNDCFEDRGYGPVRISNQERRLIWGRHVEDADRDAVLYAIATDDREHSTRWP